MAHSITDLVCVDQPFVQFLPCTFVQSLACTNVQDRKRGKYGPDWVGYEGTEPDLDQGYLHDLG